MTKRSKEEGQETIKREMDMMTELTTRATTIMMVPREDMDTKAPRIRRTNSMVQKVKIATVSNTLSKRICQRKRMSQNISSKSSLQQLRMSNN